MPAVVATGLLDCARQVFGRLPNGFYGLDTMLVEGVLRALAGEPRAEGATRIDPVALDRVLGLDRTPEVKTIRRKVTALAATGKAEELLAAMARRHVGRLDATNPDLSAVFYVDGHVRAYQGSRKVAKTRLARPSGWRRSTPPPHWPERSASTPATPVTTTKPTPWSVRPSRAAATSNLATVR